MVFDGHWKWEAQILSWELSIWSKGLFPSKYAEHRINRAILYSATILRKIIEDEMEANSLFEERGTQLPHPFLLHTTLPAIRFLYTGEEGGTFRSKLCSEDYRSGLKVALPVKDVCNWLLHSYVWSLGWSSGKNALNGFFVSSDYDKEKYVHAIQFSDWQNILKLCITESAF